MRLEISDGPFCLSAEIIPMGKDFCVAVTGGQGHVGSVCLGLAHPGLRDPDVFGATVSTVNVPGHRDGEVAGRICKRLSTAWGCAVAVVCGIHYDGLTEAEIARITALADRLTEKAAASGAALH